MSASSQGQSVSHSPMSARKKKVLIGAGSLAGIGGIAVLAAWSGTAVIGDTFETGSMQVQISVDGGDSWNDVDEVDGAFDLSFSDVAGEEIIWGPNEERIADFQLRLHPDSSHDGVLHASEIEASGFDPDMGLGFYLSDGEYSGYSPGQDDLGFDLVSPRAVPPGVADSSSMSAMSLSADSSQASGSVVLSADGTAEEFTVLGYSGEDLQQGYEQDVTWELNISQHQESDISPLLSEHMRLFAEVDSNELTDEDAVRAMYADYYSLSSSSFNGVLTPEDVALERLLDMIENHDPEVLGFFSSSADYFELILDIYEWTHGISLDLPTAQDAADFEKGAALQSYIDISLSMSNPNIHEDLELSEHDILLGARLLMGRDLAHAGGPTNIDELAELWRDQEMPLAIVSEMIGIDTEEEHVEFISDLVEWSMGERPNLSV